MWEHGFESRWGQNFMRLEIIYEDKNLIALNKPAGVNFDWVLATRPELISVHRLDKDTSGIILFAKNQKIADYLKSLFQNHKITKTYLALVVGNIKNNSGTIDLAIGRSKKTPLKRVAIGEQRGKIREAVTDYKVLKRFTWVSDTQVEFTLVEAYPKTGRTHQIRVHLKAICHPLSVDPLYGNRSAIFLSSLKADYKPKKGQTETPIISRLTLHAHRITFEPFPGVGKITVESPMAEDMDRLIRVLRRYKGSG